MSEPKYYLCIGLAFVLYIFTLQPAKAQARTYGESFYHTYFRHKGGHWLPAKKQCRMLKRFRKKFMGVSGTYFLKKKKPKGKLYKPKYVDYYEYRRKLKEEYYLSLEKARE